MTDIERSAKAAVAVFFHSLHRRSHLAHESVDPQVFKTERYRATPASAAMRSLDSSGC